MMRLLQPAQLSPQASVTSASYIVMSELYSLRRQCSAPFLINLTPFATGMGSQTNQLSKCIAKRNSPSLVISRCRDRARVHDNCCHRRAALRSSTTRYRAESRQLESRSSPIFINMLPRRKPSAGLRLKKKLFAKRKYKRI
ncbi:hypothetical protein NDU88_004232 [Pleurodeles waltl]|uniref:Uncharacterized protein n=1 Tax=Pleurodeles waltl TaxID=8319 RepID=A0AAV7SI88_PLEWA|nr:hypothetical protein NDU88_004232 [Pleurodeles waltl]